jgi:galactonate dehydratase
LVYPNERPGLGVEINEEEIARHPFQQEIPRQSFGPDGSVIDW